MRFEKKRIKRILSFSVLAIAAFTLRTSALLLFQATSTGCSGGGCNTCQQSCQQSSCGQQCDSILVAHCSQICTFHLVLFNEGSANTPCSDLGTVQTCSTAPTIFGTIQVLDSNNMTTYTMASGPWNIGSDGTMTVTLSSCMPMGKKGFSWVPGSLPGGYLDVEGCPCPQGECCQMYLDYNPLAWNPIIDPSDCSITFMVGLKPVVDFNGDPICNQCPC